VSAEDVRVEQVDLASFGDLPTAVIAYYTEWDLRYPWKLPESRALAATQIMAAFRVCLGRACDAPVWERF